MLDQRLVRRRFERAAAGFDAVDFVHASTRAGLFERLQGLTIDAKTVVDLGTATGSAVQPLQKHYAASQVVAIDSAHAMLSAARRKKRWFSKARYVQADATALPLCDSSVDVVFANLLLPWVADPSTVFTEVARVLRKEGVFIFATLGPDSLQELTAAWAGVDAYAHTHPFPDMHDIGDGLVRAGLCDPVLDVDHLKIEYRSSAQLFADLSATGARNSLQQRPPGLVGRQRFERMTSALESATSGDGIAVRLELVYGHCWGAGPRRDPSHWGVDAGSIQVRKKTL